LVLARLGPRQFWEWSSKNSRGKSCLAAAGAAACPLASSSPSSSSRCAVAARSRDFSVAGKPLAVHRRLPRRRVFPSTLPRIPKIPVREDPRRSFSPASPSPPTPREHRAVAIFAASFLFFRDCPPPSFLSVSSLSEETATPIENRARVTFATTRGDRLAAPLIIHTRSLASDGGLLIQLTTQTTTRSTFF